MSDNHETENYSAFNPYFEDVLLFTFTLPMNAASKAFIEGCLGYAHAASICGEGFSYEWFDDYTLEVTQDFTKSRRDDYSDGVEKFWDIIWVYLDEGSPLRKKAKTRLINKPEGLEIGVESVLGEEDYGY